MLDLPFAERFDPRRRKSLRTLALALSLGLLAVVSSPAPGRAEFLDDAWGRFERSLAVFDPVGRHLLSPVEKKVPALTLNGTYYFWADISTTKDQRVEYRNKDFRSLQLQNLLELEMRYRIGESVELTGIAHVLYDGVYDLQHSTGLFADRVDDDFRYYGDFERIARELYVSYRTPKLDVVVGKQQIVWGKMDGRFIDVINAIDGRESVQLEASDYEVRRLPAWMVNVTYFFGASSLNLLWIPDFVSDRGPEYGSPWFSPNIPPEDTVARRDPFLLEGRKTSGGDFLLPAAKPDWDKFGDHEFAVRLDVPTGGLTWGLIYYYAWDRSPDDVIVGLAEDGDGVERLVFHPRFKRLHHYGLTADYASALSSVPLIGELPVVLRVEALLTKGVHFADSAKQDAARAGVVTSGLTKRDTLRAAIAVEFALPKNIRMIVQPSFFYTFNWNEDLGSGFGGAVEDEWAIVPVFFIEYPLRSTRDRLKLSATVAPYVSGPERGLQGVKTKLIASYEFSEFITGRLIYTNYCGDDQMDLYGQFDEWDNIGVELQYEF
jgi:hypothetical protein